MLSVQDLDKAFINGDLSELLYLASDEQLDRLRVLVECDDIVGIRINILDLILTEMESRNMDILRRR